ncbi:integrin alpha-X isoform X2 [Amia ocellicauda]|uniref:integrin alpha-X isoform X2 n=1 Tax=Amia ocellicauda TaxID=2972642 RepID=UPI00346397B8
MGYRWMRLGHIVTVLLHFVAPPSCCFNLAPPRSVFSGDSQADFGYQVCHFGQVGRESVIVSAPFQDNGTGALFSCLYSTSRCERIPVPGAAGIALGLALACDSTQLVVCGPRLAHDCGHLRYLNGRCVLLDRALKPTGSLSPAFQECKDSGLDAVILFDDSQSISDKDFQTMISFIRDVIRMFSDPLAQVAVAQYSTHVRTIFNFENFAAERDPEKLLHFVPHTKGQTYTPTAIKYVLDQMLTEARGMRPQSRKLLVVITDGRSNDKKMTFNYVIPEAERRGVVRYAIGVGEQSSEQELRVIASTPQDVFQVNSFDALSSIRSQLEEKIFAIEGTNKQSNFTSFQLEMSQGGFSAAVGQDSILLGAVGAFEWSGGFVESLRSGGGGNGTFINASISEPGIRDSYLGYAVAVARVAGGSVYFAGAPRLGHVGAVLVFQGYNATWRVTQRLHGHQLGSYFGAAMCVLDLTGDGQTDTLVSLNCTLMLRGSPGNQRGRFGASLSAIPDLDGDGVPELAVGAPLEGEGRGSLYLFRGHRDGIHSTPSQKVEGASVRAGLQFFSQSVHSAGDLSQDGLTDIAVGAQGGVVVLRSQPVINVTVLMTFSPEVISQDTFHCGGTTTTFGQTVTTATICVTLNGVHTGKLGAAVRAKVSVSVSVEPQRRTSRLLLSPTSLNPWTDIITATSCYNLSVAVPACISDYTPVPVSASVSVEGQEIQGSDGLRSILHPLCPTTVTQQVPLELVCGEDQVCVSDLAVSLNFTRPEVVASPGFLAALGVTILNAGEDSSGCDLSLRFPPALSFTRASVSQSTWPSSLSCSVDPGQPDRQGTGGVSCQVSPLVLRKGCKVTLLVVFSVRDPSALGQSVTVNASVTSKNENATLEDNIASHSVPVLLPVNVILRELDATRHVTFKEKSQHSASIQHTYQVENLGSQVVPVNVSLVVPVELESGFVWDVSVPPVTKGTVCVKAGPPYVNSSLTPCEARLCVLIRCTIRQLTSEPIRFTLVGNVIRNTEEVGVQVAAVSQGLLSFDQRQYIQYPAGSFHQLSVSTALEVPAVPNLVGLIVGSCIGGLVILGVICLGLAKMGFFQGLKAPCEDTADLNKNEEQKEATAPPGADAETSL